ncbi:SDR family oxidoreductase [Kushneria phosphatilytica]|uniref:SDR family NAD(P)-dependent oxidoreductase n=1 Tax=Kushneria phosphatilytica TaxID=657387 RepID=A0A1S1NNA1_9GAMM|nr:SDR family NAD(P)-dependent oxidoreductase [Kushneria phosphatilytica]OHV08752.1 short-chain dehydrogenase [Kushneria phosphatilytica]QEL12473.1 SDR family NAD(P)-dependent oxidoreductase [Kushneria phosphatilytica]
MDLSGNTVLVTGGGSGIGLAIAERFLDAGSEVIICGRREDRLREAQQQHPALHVRVGDVEHQQGREALIEQITREFPNFNVLVNNAGLQRRHRFAEDDAPWSERQQEIAINFEAPVHLASLVLDHFRAQPRAAVINVSSGLAFVPGLFAPVYSATKAALHSFSLSLRGELAHTPIEVIEIAPPAVNTDLGGVGVHVHGEPVDAFADSVMQRIAAGEVEVGYGGAEERRRASRAELDAWFERMNGPLMQR